MTTSLALLLPGATAAGMLLGAATMSGTSDARQFLHEVATREFLA
jgi:hypothetical protein